MTDNLHQVTICHCFHNITPDVQENVTTQAAIRKRKSIPVRNQSHFPCQFYSFSLYCMLYNTVYKLRVCICLDYSNKSRSQWPRRLRRGPAAARLLRFRNRISPGAWMSVSCEWRVLSSRGLSVGLIARPGDLYRV